MINLDDKLRIYSVNINAAGFNMGIQAKEIYIHDMISELKPDVLFLLECDTQNYVVHETFKARGYKQFVSAACAVGEKGVRKTRVIALVRFGVVKSSDQVKHGVGERAEIWLELVLKNNEKLCVAGIYREWVKGRSQAGRDDVGFNRMLAKYSKRKLIAMGDFNCCIVKAKSKPESKQGEMLDSIQQLGYRVEDAGYTFHRLQDGDMYRSGLDWAITNVDGITIEQEAMPFTDHAAISTTITGRVDTQWSKKRSRNKQALYSIDSQIKLAERDWWSIYGNSTNDNRSLNDLAHELINEILIHRDAVAPEKVKWSTHDFNLKDTPQMTSIRRAISNAIRQGRSKAVARLKRRYRHVIRKKRIAHAEEIMSKDGPGAIWKLFREMTQVDRVDIEIVENAIVLTNKQAADSFLEYFEGKVSRLRDRANPDGHMPHGKKGGLLEGFDFVEVTVEEILRKVGKMKNTDSKDAFGLSQTDMKKLIKSVVAPLTSVVNLSLRSGEYPDRWKIARVVPCPKPGKPTNELSSYRPLSMLVPFGKVIEACVKDQMQNYARRSGYIPESQHGYQKGKSCDTAIGHALRVVDEAIKKGKKVAAVLYDYSAAFDLVDAELLIKKLGDMGCGRRAIKWVRSYLRERTIYVEVAGESSKRIVLDYGSPQGSILSPLLFILLVADMHVNLPGEVVGYCDDTTNLLKSDSVEELRKMCEKSIVQMTEYASAMGLALNLDKTELMCFGKHKIGDIEIDGQKVKECNEVKFLGIWFSKSRSLKTHLDKTIPKLNQKIGVMKRISKTLPKQALKTIAKATIGGVIQSCALSALDPVNQRGRGQIERLQRVYNAAARVALKKRHGDKTGADILMAELGSDSVKKMAIVRLMKAAYGIHGENGPMSYLRHFEGDPRAAKRERRDRYKDLLPEWIEGRSLTLKSRIAWNLLEVAGLSPLKVCPTAAKFEREVRLNYDKLVEAIENRWVNRG